MLYLFLGTIFNFIIESFKFINYFKYFFFCNYKYNVEEYESEINKDKLKILNWNIHYGKNIFEKDTLIEICDFIKNLNVDICVLQEVCFNKKFNQIDILKKSCGYDYHYYKVNESLFDYNKCNVILSKYPIINRKFHKFNQYFFRPNKNSISIRIKYKMKFIWISNIHLSCDITGYQQNEQINEFIDTIDFNESNIICGDFNSLLNYKCFKKLKEKMNNGIVSKTFPSIFPLYQLDYVLFNHLNILKIKKLETKLSDHLPLLIEL